jgi:hypothetical protein
MRICFLFDTRVFAIPEACYAVRNLALLMGLPARLAPAGSPLGDEEIPVRVGAPVGTDEAAAVLPVGTWEVWDSAAVRLAAFEGVPLPCPEGRFPQPCSPAEFPEPWLRAVAWLLTREEEQSETRRDEWECFAGSFSRQQELGVLDTPLVNRYADQLHRRIAIWCARHDRRPDPLPRWKDGARFAVVLSHDVDDIRCYSWAEVFRLLGRARGPASYAARRSLAQALRLLRRGPAQGDPYWQFEKWMGAETRHGFRSTFYVFPPEPSPAHEFDPTYRLADRIEFEGRSMPFHRLLAEMVARGFEVGLHGGYNSFRSAAELRREKEQVERELGAPIHGLRQHYLRFDARATWSAQQEAGFLYDSTLGYNEAVGFRAGIAAPFRPWHPERREPHRILELPLTVMDGVLFRTLKLDARLAERRVREHLETVESAGGLGVLLWHPNGADARLFPGWWDSYERVLEYLGRRSAWVPTGAELAQWWAAREARVLVPSPDG